MKKLSNTETELKKDIAYTKSVYYESKLPVTTVQKPLYIDSALMYIEMLNFGDSKTVFFKYLVKILLNVNTEKTTSFQR